MQKRMFKRWARCLLALSLSFTMASSCEQCSSGTIFAFHFILAVLGRPTYIAGYKSPGSPGQAQHLASDSTSDLFVYFLARQANCSLTAYLADTDAGTASPAQANYQDVLHQQAQLTTKGDQWTNGCADTRIGVPSGVGIIEKNSSGLYYGAMPTSYLNSALTDSISVGSFTADATSITPLATYALPGTVASLTSVDLNGDGNPDLIVVSNDPSTQVATVSVLLGNGDGTYQSPTNYPTQLVTFNVTVSPVASGGPPDLIVVGLPNSGTAAVQVFPNNGHGSFGVAIDGPVLPNGGVIAAVADFNNDNKADIATDSGYVLLGDGTGHFTLKGEEYPEYPGPASSLVAADFNHDGKIDIAAVNDNTVSIFLGNGDGTFTAGQQYASPEFNFPISVSDLDGDGNPDLIIGTADPHGFGPALAAFSDVTYFLLGRGDGTFAGVPAYPVQPPFGIGLGPAFAVADLNGDNKPDIVTTNASSEGLLSLKTLLGNGDGTFNPGFTGSIDATSAAAVPLVLADRLTNSGDNDAIVGVTTGSNTGELAIFLGKGNDSFDSELDTPVASSIGAMIAGVFKHSDPGMDLIAGGATTTDSQSNPTSGAVFFLPGQGNGRFGTPSRIASPVNPVSFAAADLNKDTDLDLVVADGGSPNATFPIAGSVEVYLGNGDGTFQTPKSLTAPIYPAAVAIADVNHDGNQDVVVLTGPNNNQANAVSTVYVFFGDGHGNFESGIATTLDQYDNGLQVADLDGDNLPDLMLTSCCGIAYTEVLKGNGDGTFGQPGPLLVGMSSSYPIIASVSGHPNPDLLVSNGNFINVLVNLFAEHLPPPIGPSASPTATLPMPTPTLTPKPSTATPTRTPGPSTPTASPTLTPNPPTPTASATATRTSVPTHTPTATPTPSPIMVVGKATLSKVAKFAASTAHPSQTRSFKVTNQSKNSKKSPGPTITIGESSITPSLAGDTSFKVTQQCTPAQLPPGKSCEGMITFAPTEDETASYSETLMVTTSIQSSPTLTTPLSGTFKAAKPKK